MKGEREAAWGCAEVKGGRAGMGGVRQGGRSVWKGEWSGGEGRFVKHIFFLSLLNLTTFGIRAATSHLF